MARKVFLTGASSGLGRALALHYAAAGAVLGLVARREQALESLAAGLPGEVLVYPADVGDAGAMARAGRDFIARAGLPDLVIANAGVSAGTLTEEAGDLAAFARILQTNVLGIAHAFHPFVAPMREARRGTLAGIASVAGIRGLAGAGAYCASKSAAITYLESLRLELRAAGVRVVTVLPGYVATPMTAVNRYPMPFLLPPEEAARRIARAIARGRRYAVVPWQMAIVAKILRALPDAAYERLFERAGRKPRGLLP
ncbi:MAG: SDR family oxidoreductase [Rhodocyclaceae bacterium]